jgi:hypothetical protein
MDSKRADFKAMYLVRSMENVKRKKCANGWTAQSRTVSE